MKTRRAFLKAVALTAIGVSSCSHQSKEKEQGKTQVDLEKRPIEVKPVPTFRVIPMKVTAYCSCSKCCGRFADGITASGYIIKNGDKFIAADKCYPFLTLMRVPGYSDGASILYCRNYGCIAYDGFVPVLDRGGAIKGNHIDVYFDSHQEALNWGVKYLDVVILSFSESEHEKLLI